MVKITVLKRVTSSPVRDSPYIKPLSNGQVRQVEPLDLSKAQVQQNEKRDGQHYAQYKPANTRMSPREAYTIIRNHFAKTGTTVLYSRELRIAAILVRSTPNTDDGIKNTE